MHSGKQQIIQTCPKRKDVTSGHLTASKHVKAVNSKLKQTVDPFSNSIILKPPFI